MKLFSYETVLSDRTIVLFIKALRSNEKGRVDNIKAIWDKYPLLQAYLTGKRVNFTDNNQLGPRAISLKEQVEIFKAALGSGCISVMRPIWICNSLLQVFFRGEVINFGNNKFGQPDRRWISQDALIENYRSALNSHCSEIIEAMWNNNPRLHNAIRSLNNTQSKALLENVLSTTSFVKDDIINRHIDLLNNPKMIQDVLDETIKRCANTKLSAYQSRKILLLQKYLDEKTKSAVYFVPTANPLSFVIFTQNSSSENRKALDEGSNQNKQDAPSKKRKAVQEPSQNKRAKTVITELELSQLVKEIPVEATDQQSFVIDSETHPILDTQNLNYEFDENSWSDWPASIFFGNSSNLGKANGSCGYNINNNQRGNEDFDQNSIFSLGGKS